MNREVGIKNGSRLNDLAFRLILIPTFGIAIPLITGMTNDVVDSHWQQKLSFIYTIGIAFVVWEGNRYLLFTLRSYFGWLNSPVRRIAALVGSISFFTVPVSILLHIGWYNLFANDVVNWEIVQYSTLIILVCVLFISHTYETVFLVKETETEKLRNADLQRSKAEAELETLKNQVDPHFMFNSLNTLSHLIAETPAKALDYNDKLAEVYRFILYNKGKDFISLTDELQFASSYYHLLKIRFGDSINMSIDKQGENLDNILIPPISIQLLVENAIKHNEFDNEKKLNIHIAIYESHIEVCNNRRPRQSTQSSSKIGLTNLVDRFSLLLNDKPHVNESESKFIVNLPFIRIM